MAGYNHLNGTIPSELERLTNLRYLDISYNNLHGTVPTFLAELVNLGKLFSAHFF
jgi:hypothetical protein